ncbi:HNH endonuclease signature motif containing protein [Polaromonas sp. CG_23.6]|uniref:HNH endonuclease n=1 Tax=Polaromonas sp. CG_23.6 TaxID=2760709 RepID=UPI0024737FE5|nr:HNH endonuclease signature motif containing protein [Polaromonas sp. CG_23.6]MDH6183592.1 hypothetical protein [Polaromonas sp. CG_23.6]
MAEQTPPEESKGGTRTTTSFWVSCSNKLAKSNAQITRVVLDSSKVSNLPVGERIAKLATTYPVNLNSIDIKEFRKILQREIAQMHRDPNVKQGGNAQKRIRICLNKSVDPDELISRTEGPGIEYAEAEFAPGVTGTERSYLRTSRVGQGQFRQDLIRVYEGRCPISGIEHDQLLIASHIKPWKVCTNAERLDSSNGILLSALVDRLFDKGLITFSQGGAAIVSPWLSTNDKAKCGIENWQALQLTARSKRYMEYHRAVEFKST